jgi:hypothetical protein
MPADGKSTRGLAEDVASPAYRRSCMLLSALASAPVICSKQTRRGSIATTDRLEDASHLPGSMFLREVVEQFNPVVAHARAEREGESLSIEQVRDLGICVQTSIDAGGVCQAFLRTAAGDPVLLARRHGGSFLVSAAADDAARAGRLAESIATAIRVERQEHDERVSVAFWSGPGDAFLGAAAPRWRKLALPCFAEVEQNYPVEVRRPLQDLFSQPSGHVLPGRIALWHGPPGTGKTWALRALGREWRDWCDLHYITDPERLLGGDTTYMLGVLAGRSDPSELDVDEDEDYLDGDGDGAEDERWRLLVLEDAGELLGIGAPAEVGRGFARLLNIADGLLGQGSRALILVTTNEALGKLHPAALRPGRAMATIEFASLGVDEANEWLRRRGVERRVDSAATIAELHAILAGASALAPACKPVGFG